MSGGRRVLVLWLALFAGLGLGCATTFAPPDSGPRDARDQGSEPASDPSSDPRVEEIATDPGAEPDTASDPAAEDVAMDTPADVASEDVATDPCASCPAGTTCCLGACVTTATDPVNCGGCGIRCAAGRSCCASRCVDLATDPANCGSCGRFCPLATPVCGGGACAPTCSCYCTDEMDGTLHCRDDIYNVRCPGGCFQQCECNPTCGPRRCTACPC